MKAKDYIDDLVKRGRYTFSSEEALSALGTQANAVYLSLHRLKKQGEIATPARGFYTIIPLEYRSLGSLPPEQFIPALMDHLGLAYYAGLLSAAQYYGAAHHRPQEFQVFVARNRKPIKCGAVRIAFIARKNVGEVSVQSFNTPAGTIRVSTPEATALDLVGYYQHAGGMDQVATILSELGEKLDPDKLVAAAKSAPVPWAQRLGYLLEFVEHNTLTDPLQEYVQGRARDYTELLPASERKDAQRSARWKLIINADVEAEL